MRKCGWGRGKRGINLLLAGNRAAGNKFDHLMSGAADLKAAAFTRKRKTKDEGVMLELSVIICAHNPRPHYLGRVLEALRSQTLPKQQWELLLIDNSSSTPLRAQWDISWHPNGRAGICR